MNSTAEICNQYGIKNYTINEDGSIDVNGDVNLERNSLVKLPVKFNKVTGKFSCSYNNLIDLENAPNFVGGDFRCYNNQLNTLEGVPTFIGGTICCTNFYGLWAASSYAFRVSHANDNWVIKENAKFKLATATKTQTYICSNRSIDCYGCVKARPHEYDGGYLTMTCPQTNSIPVEQDAYWKKDISEE